MRRQGLDCFLIEKPIDIFYYTGVRLSRGALLIDQRKSYLLVDGRYIEAAKKTAPCPVMKEGKESLLSLLTLEKNSKEKRVAFDPATCSYLDYKEMKQLVNEGKKKGASLLLIERQGLLQKIRGIKDEKEIACLKKSAQLLYKGYEFLLTKVKVGVREAELAREFEFFCRKEGAEALSFEPIIAFGKHSAYPHHHSGDRKLKRGEPILVDIGVLLNGYCSDMTRVHFFGKVSPKLEEIYEVVKKAAAAAASQCLPGKKLKEVDTAARKVLRKAGYEKNFLHSLGHGIGLEIHEYPRFSPYFLEDVLRPGMVLTIEPGIYLEEVGGVRYEDTILITKGGNQNLFK